MNWAKAISEGVGNGILIAGYILIVFLLYQCVWLIVGGLQ